MKLKSSSFLLINCLSLNKERVGTVVCYDRTKQGTKDVGHTAASQSMDSRS